MVGKLENNKATISPDVMDDEAGSGTRIAVERFFAELDISIRSSIELSSNEAIKQAIQADLGLGIMSIHTVSLQ